jgi:hypothetical protein
VQDGVSGFGHGGRGVRGPRPGWLVVFESFGRLGRLDHRFSVQNAGQLAESLNEAIGEN